MNNSNGDQYVLVDDIVSIIRKEALEERNEYTQGILADLANRIDGIKR
jgi:hypothetical protein